MHSHILLYLVILGLATATTLNSILEDNELRPRTNTGNCRCGTWCCESLSHHCGYVAMAGGWSCFPNDKDATSLILGPTSFAAPISSTSIPGSTATLTSSLSELSSQAVATPASETTTPSGTSDTVSSPSTTSTSTTSSSSSRFSFSRQKYFTAAATIITAFLLFS